MNLKYNVKIKEIFNPKLFTTLRNYTYSDFLSDLTAGTIVGIVALPLAIAFGIASGVSPERGLITAIIAGFLISALGGSRVQIGGPTGAFIVIVYGIVEKFGVSGLIIATIMAGLMLITMGILKLGTVIKFMPYPIIVGFTSGIALLIFSTQISDFAGISSAKAVPADFVEKWGYYFENFSTANIYAIIIGTSTILISVLWAKVNRKVPGTLIAILVTTIVVSFFQLPVTTIGSRFGEIKASIPAPKIPYISFQHFRTLVPSAFTIAILGAIESLLSAMVADGATGGRHRSNTELIAQGIANVITPLFGGIPATGAIARTMTNIKNGGKTPVAGIIHSIVLLLIMLFLGKWATYIPMSCLAGILIVVAYNMSEWRSFKSIFNNTKSDIAVLLTTFILTVIIDLTVAIQFGLLLAIFMFLKRVIETSEVQLMKVVNDDATSEFSDDFTPLNVPKGVEVFEVNGPFFFGIVNKFEAAEKQVKKKPIIYIIRLRRVPFIDSTGIRNLTQFLKRNINSGVKIFISGASLQVEDSLRKNKIIEIIGEENLFEDVHQALDKAKSIIK